MHKSSQLLQNGLLAMQVNLSVTQQHKLLDYVELLTKWNKAYNLTAIRTVDQIIPVHILDSLSLLPYMQSVANVLDVGTGAGLPGIPLAIAKPQTTFTLLDSLQKKMNFVQHVATTLQLTNVSVVTQRIETLQLSHKPDMIVSRAFASLDEFVKLIANVCDQHTKIVAMKGKYDQVLQELTVLPANFELVNIEQLKVPGINAERCLVFIKKKDL